MKRTNRGFTLVELIIVIAVIGVLAAILIPTFANVIDKSNAKSAYSDARNVVTDLITDYTEVTTDFPDLLIFSVKGKKLYAFGYDPEIGQVLEYKDNPIASYDPNGAELKDQVDTIISELAGTGALQIINENTLPEIFRFDGPNGLYQAIIRNSFDPEILCVRADTLIQDLVFFGVDQQQTQGGGVSTPTPAPEETIVTITPTYDSGTDAFVCTIPAGTPADAKIVLDMSGFTDKLKDDAAFNFNPGNAFGYGITINDESGHNFAITNASFKSDMITALQDHDLTKAQELGLVEEAKPVITQSTKFKAYMKELKDEYGIGDGSTTFANVQTYYIDEYNRGTLTLTYTDYLKSCYGGTLENIPLMDIVSSQASVSLTPAYYDANVGDGIAAGSTVRNGDVYLRHVEPEVIALILDNLYDQSVTMSFLEEYSQFDMYLNSVCDPFSSFYNYVGADWKTHYSGMNFSSLYDLVARNSYPEGLNFKVTDNGASRTISGAILVSWHGGTATDAYQGTIIDGVPDFSITLEAQG